MRSCARPHPPNKINCTSSTSADFYIQTSVPVPAGKDFYGPDGVYPFAGRECARAFALLSTNTEDCNDNLEGLDKMEMDNLQGWQAKFYGKYPLVGRIVS